MNPESPSGPAAGATPSPDGTHSSSEGAAIKSVKLRHPIRNIFAVIIVLFAAAFVYDAALRPAFNWPQVAKYVFDRRISEAAFNTLQLTVYSMVIAVLPTCTRRPYRCDESIGSGPDGFNRPRRAAGQTAFRVEELTGAVPKSLEK